MQVKVNGLAITGINDLFLEFHTFPCYSVSERKICLLGGDSRVLLKKVNDYSMRISFSSGKKNI